MCKGPFIAQTSRVVKKLLILASLLPYLFIYSFSFFWFFIHRYCLEISVKISF